MQNPALYSLYRMCLMALIRLSEISFELPNYVRAQLTILIKQHLENVIPNKFIYMIVWDAAHLDLEGLDKRNCHIEIDRCIVHRLKEVTFHYLFIPLLTDSNVQIPDWWVTSRDLFEVLETHVNIYTVKGVRDVYKSLNDLGAESPYFKVIHAWLTSKPKRKKWSN